MYRYRYTGTETTCFVTTQRNANPGEILETPTLQYHPLLQLIEDEGTEEAPTESAVVPETIESPVSGDELKEN